MDLDLERFWEVVRPNRRKPAPEPAQKPISSAKPLNVWLEAVNPLEEACTERIQALLQMNENHEFFCEAAFPEFTRTVAIVGFRLYLRANVRNFRYIECSPRNIRAGDSLRLNLVISDDANVKRQLIDLFTS